MSEETTLDRFVDADADGGADADETSDREAGSTGGADPGADGADATPATVTYRWASDGAACPACGASARRLWRDEDGTAVCADCKTW